MPGGRYSLLLTSLCFSAASAHVARADDARLVASARHPFWVTNRDADGDGRLGEWIEVHRLKVGDRVRLTDGSEAVLNDIEAEEDPTHASPSADHSPPFTAYNFSVAETHTYFVGHEGVWVHNHCPPGPIGTKSLNPSPALNDVLTWLGVEQRVNSFSKFRRGKSVTISTTEILGMITFDAGSDSLVAGIFDLRSPSVVGDGLLAMRTFRDDVHTVGRVIQEQIGRPVQVELFGGTVVNEKLARVLKDRFGFTERRVRRGPPYDDMALVSPDEPTTLTIISKRFAIEE